MKIWWFNNKTVFILVHCVSGISRSASIVIAYIMDKYKMNYDQAFSYVKTKRTTIRPNTNFVEQLNNLQWICFFFEFVLNVGGMFCWFSLIKNPKTIKL